jgi:hypothetical protein
MSRFFIAARSGVSVGSMLTTITSKSLPGVRETGFRPLWAACITMSHSIGQR